MQPPPDELIETTPRLGDRYALLAKLGSGGMGHVYAGWDVQAEVWRAIKVLLPDLAQSQTLARRFELEAQTMMALKSPHLVEVLDVGREYDLPYIVMELVGAGSLHQWQERHGPMPARLAVDAARQLCDALTVVHEAGVVHRDVKPHNVLVDVSGTVKLTDFGIARSEASGGTRTGLAMGTMGFMSPEQLHDAKSTDHRTDLYALGATLWTMITAREPQDMFRVTEHPHLLEGVPAALHGVLVGCLTYQREGRFDSAVAMREALTSVWISLPPLPAGTPSLPLAIDPPELTQDPSITFSDLLRHISESADSLPVGDSTVLRTPPAEEDEEELPAYLAGVEQTSDALRPELITGGHHPATLERRFDPRPLLRRIAVGSLVLGLVIVAWTSVGVVDAARRLANLDRRVEEAQSTLVGRATAAAPLVEELAALGADPEPLRSALDRIDAAATLRDKAREALRFVDGAERSARSVAQSDRHDARLVRQRVDRVRAARDDLAGAWTACMAASEESAGGLARAIGLVTPACEPGGEL